MITSIIRQTIGGAFMMALFALIVDPEVFLPFVLSGAIGGAVFGLFLGLGRDSLWTQIADINSMIIVVTFAVAILVLPIDFFEVGGLMGIIVIDGFLISLVASFFSNKAVATVG